MASLPPTQTPTIPLLPNSPSRSLLNPKSLLLFSPLLLLIAAILLLSAALLLSSPPKPLRRPAVLLLSFDGFRFGYQFKAPTPNLRRLVSTGTAADLGLIPVFPSFTFPNHYSIATGLFPAFHGIVSNSFSDPATGERFTVSNHDPKWWLGEPIWETAVNQGLNAAVYFWAGGEVRKGSWTCPPKFCPKYNQSVPFEERIDAVLGFFDLPTGEIPDFVAVYFSDPDRQGHEFGPDHPEITKSVAYMDGILGRLIDGLEKRGIFEDVSVILLGDHGMVGVFDKNYIFLEDLAPWIEIPSHWVQSQYQLLAIRPSPNVSAAGVVAKMNEGLSSGKVGNGNRLRVYLKEDLPARLHYSASDRISPIIGIVDEGYSVEVSRSQGSKSVGAHGYDNALFSMRSIFVGHGPRFERGRKIPSFVNVEVYNLIASILKLKAAPNNGTDSFASSVLLGSS